MKVLMQGRYELLSKGGGDKVQIENTASELRKIGVDVDVLAGDCGDYSKYDLVHLFQLDWTPETYFHAVEAKKANKPLVLSPIHHSVKEVKRFDDLYVYDFRRIAKILFRDQHRRDTFKNVYRCFFNPHKVVPTLKSMVIGLKKMHQRTLQMSDMVLVQTQAEAVDLKETYGVDIRWRKVVNGVGEQFMNQEFFENNLGVTDYVISVGRIEPRKNQLTIVEAVDKLRKSTGRDIKLVFIGTLKSEKHFEYKFRFLKALKKYPWITHIEHVPYHDIPSYYHFAKVCVSASWFETTGLTVLEALFCGTNAVASGDRAKEYVGDLISYCDPASVDSIYSAVAKEYSAPRPQVRADMYKDYTWENAAKATLGVYKEVLNES